MPAAPQWLRCTRCVILLRSRCCCRSSSKVDERSPAPLNLATVNKYRLLEQASTEGWRFRLRGNSLRRSRSSGGSVRRKSQLNSIGAFQKARSLVHRSRDREQFGARRQLHYRLFCTRDCTMFSMRMFGEFSLAVASHTNRRRFSLELGTDFRPGSPLRRIGRPFRPT